MSPGDETRAIMGAQAIGPSRLRLIWSDETTADLDLAAVLDDPAFAALHNPSNSLASRSETGVTASYGRPDRS
jgi:hypothetical protein